jgi:hypothetical protein
MNSRELLEKAVLGMALENRYSLVGNILNSKNFNTTSRFNHKSIWRAMEMIFPTGPINILSVSSFLFKQDGISYHHYLCELSNFAVSDNIKYFSIQLLELDIREKLAELIKLERRKSVDKNEFQLAQEFDKMIFSCQDWTQDIFESIDKIESYLMINLKRSVSETLLNFFNSIPKKIRLIKSESQLQLVLSHLLTISPELQNRQVKILTEEIIFELKSNMNNE